MTDRYIEYIPIDDLVPADINEKGHADAEIEASIDRFGYNTPIELDERTGKMLAGHGRLDALKALRESGQAPPDGIGKKWEAPVVRGYATANDEEATAYRIANNQLTVLGGWINEALAASLEAIDDLRGVGFNPDDIDDLLAKLDLVNYVPPEPFTGGYAEDENGEPAIVSREGGENVESEAAGVGGTKMREIVLLYKPDDHAAMIERLKALGRAWDVTSLASIVKRCILEAG